MMGNDAILGIIVASILLHLPRWAALVMLIVVAATGVVERAEQRHARKGKHS